MFSVTKNIKLSNASCLLPYNHELIVGTDGGKLIKLNNEYEQLYDLQIFKPDFDTLESVDISQQVVCIKSYQTGELCDSFICCNEKTIKSIKILENNLLDDFVNNYKQNNEILDSSDKIIKYYTSLRKEKYGNNDNFTIKTLYENKKSSSYNINTLDIRENMLISTDYLRINLWNYKKMDMFINLIDLKPNKLDELDSVITHAIFNGTNILCYSNSHGEIIFNDIRTSTTPKKLFEIKNENRESIYSELLNSISEFKFYDENTIIARDFNSLNFFDIRNKKIVENINLFEIKKKNIDEIIQNGCGYERFVFDIFENKIVTGGFNGNVYFIDILTKEKCNKRIETNEFNDVIKNVCFFDKKAIVCSKKNVIVFENDDKM